MIKSSSFPTILITGGTEDQREKVFEKITRLELKSALNNPDFFLLTSETSLGIEAVRQLQKSLQLKPFKSEKKIAFIKNAHQLTLAAQNALLKTLEEPGPKSMIVLTAPDSFLLLPTIVSRCQVIVLTQKTEIQIETEELNALLKDLRQLFQSSTGERFCWAEEKRLYEDRQKAMLWLNKLTFVTRKKLLDCFLAERPGAWNNLVLTIKLLEKTRQRLLANCNVRLTLEVFLSQMPRANSAQNQG